MDCVVHSGSVKSSHIECFICSHSNTGRICSRRCTATRCSCCSRCCSWRSAWRACCPLTSSSCGCCYRFSCAACSTTACSRPRYSRAPRSPIRPPNCTRLPRRRLRPAPALPPLLRPPRPHVPLRAKPGSPPKTMVRRRLTLPCLFIVYTFFTAEPYFNNF